MIAHVLSWFGGHLQATRENIVTIRHGEVYTKIFWRVF